MAELKCVKVSTAVSGVCHHLTRSTMLFLEWDFFKTQENKHILHVAESLQIVKQLGKHSGKKI